MMITILNRTGVLKASLAMAIWLLVTFSPSIVFSEDALTIEVDNMEMNAAIEEAKKTLPIFLAHVIEPDGDGLLEASLKVSFKVSEGPIVDEFIWVGPFHENSDGTFTGFLANDPVHIDQKFGDEVTFTLEQILDWSIWHEDEKTYGSYTTRALLDLLPVEEANKLREELSETPVPGEWLEEAQLPSIEAGSTEEVSAE